jgi:hypothetical protein
MKNLFFNQNWWKMVVNIHKKRLIGINKWLIKLQHKWNNNKKKENKNYKNLNNIVKKKNNNYWKIFKNNIILLLNNQLLKMGLVKNMVSLKELLNKKWDYKWVNVSNHKLV